MLLFDSSSSAARSLFSLPLQRAHQLLPNPKISSNDVLALPAPVSSPSARCKTSVNVAGRFVRSRTRALHFLCKRNPPSDISSMARYGLWSKSRCVNRSGPGRFLAAPRPNLAASAPLLHCNVSALCSPKAQDRP
jgi:hypothetical protein